jgi:6-phosphofructokinase
LRRWKEIRKWYLGGVMTIEVRDKRFGVIAVENGFITNEQLFEALKMQVEEDLSGKPHTLIGVILIKLGYMTREQADEILVAMRKK